MIDPDQLGQARSQGLLNKLHLPSRLSCCGVAHPIRRLWRQTDDVRRALMLIHLLIIFYSTNRNLSNDSNLHRHIYRMWRHIPSSHLSFIYLLTPSSSRILSVVAVHHHFHPCPHFIHSCVIYHPRNPIQTQCQLLNALVLCQSRPPNLMLVLDGLQGKCILLLKHANVSDVLNKDSRFFDSRTSHRPSFIPPTDPGYTLARHRVWSSEERIFLLLTQSVSTLHQSK